MRTDATCALLPVQALAGAKEKVAALAPSKLVLVMDEKGNELVFQSPRHCRQQIGATGHRTHATCC